MVQRIITNIRFWMWAAMHSYQFKSFRIGFKSLIKVKANYYQWSYERLVLHVSFCPLSFIYDVDFATAEDFIKTTKACTIDDLFGFDDIPF
jgi:hypothetical protein